MFKSMPLPVTQDRINDWAGGEKFGFPSLKHPGTEQQLKQLELRLKSLVRDIEFRNFTDEFQDKLKRDVRMIKEAPKLIIEADKNANYYQLSEEEYQELITPSIHKDYKKAAEQDLRGAVEQQKKVIEGYDLGDRVMKTQARPARATLKDHKDNFQEDPKIRLII